MDIRDISVYEIGGHALIPDMIKEGTFGIVIYIKRMKTG